MTNAEYISQNTHLKHYGLPNAGLRERKQPLYEYKTCGCKNARSTTAFWNEMYSKYAQSLHPD